MGMKRKKKDMRFRKQNQNTKIVKSIDNRIPLDFALGKEII